MKIWILWWIWAQASSSFYQKLIDALKNTNLIKKNIDYPQIVINHIPAPEILWYGNDNIDDYIKWIRELQFFDPDIVCMICNTIHIYYDQILKETGCKQIINLPLLVKKHLEKFFENIYIVLWTPNSLKNNLYTFQNIQYDNPPEEILTEIERWIINFNVWQDYILTRNILRKYIDMQIAKYWSKVVFIYWCTEIIDLVWSYHNKYINTMDLLWDHIIQQYTDTKQNKP